MHTAFSKNFILSSKCSPRKSTRKKSWLCQQADLAFIPLCAIPFGALQQISFNQDINTISKGCLGCLAIPITSLGRGSAAELPPNSRHLFATSVRLCNSETTGRQDLHAASAYDTARDGERQTTCYGSVSARRRKLSAKKRRPQAVLTVDTKARRRIRETHRFNIRFPCAADTMLKRERNCESDVLAYVGMIRARMRGGVNSAQQVSRETSANTPVEAYVRGYTTTPDGEEMIFLCQQVNAQEFSPLCMLNWPARVALVTLMNAPIDAVTI
ncbi:hypothetical protein CAPTEDRAFT_207461 [Capitella teleta]|uniref:Uncharacterized protein n=1 Tax=Capitella teleta TaxID=283909 RepID=R7TT01_CAPTE|nr:hypothetical protein CAPTEDRAFT_207461 [Capitella teleta]|eukprot:ELT94616.1 hypothetical protein CAPTEDRAFT_207461 [Capitella teleta]